ncbi:hypothetical protein C1645_842734 [Glomus cerebriforme]|uniref:Uncharacterized protein n=1 Tax=Glomus cerebriforme TaxID=658196 RepID=A0A397S1T2_9GLOM|nr:hypothetical protein C1645_842734 [Glomus cerebriforme]
MFIQLWGFGLETFGSENGNGNISFVIFSSGNGNGNISFVTFAPGLGKQKYSALEMKTKINVLTERFFSFVDSALETEMET